MNNLILRILDSGLMEAWITEQSDKRIKVTAASANSVLTVHAHFGELIFNLIICFIES